MISGECAFPPPLNHEIITDDESKQVKHGFKKTKSQRKSFLTGFTIVRCREIFLEYVSRCGAENILQKPHRCISSEDLPC